MDTRLAKSLDIYSCQDHSLFHRMRAVALGREPLGEKLPAEELAKLLPRVVHADGLGDAKPPSEEARRDGYIPRVGGAVAIIPMYGVIQARGNWMMQYFGGTGCDYFMASCRAAMADDGIKGILIDCNSPGGGVQGPPEVSDYLFSLRESGKPCVAIANPLCASAAYWPLTAASPLCIVPSGDCGSVGVYSFHEDYSRMLEAEGVTVSIISAGDKKVDANPYMPLSESARKDMQDRVDEMYEEFCAAVARNRGVSVNTVKSDFGQGSVVRAKAAKKAGMVDRIAEMSKVLTEMGVSLVPQGKGGKMAAKSVQQNKEATAKLLDDIKAEIADAEHVPGEQEPPKEVIPPVEEPKAEEVVAPESHGDPGVLSLMLDLKAKEQGWSEDLVAAGAKE